MITSICKVIVELLCLSNRIESVWLLIIDPWSIIIKDVKVKVIRRAVVIVKSMSEDVYIFSKALFIWHPDPLQWFFIHSFILVHIVKSCKEPGIESHFCEKSYICIWVTEWIDLPANSWLNSELFENPLVTDLHVVDHIIICWASLIMHGPPSINNFKLPIGDEFVNPFFHWVILVIPPHSEEFHLNLWEFSVWVVLKSPHDTG